MTHAANIGIKDESPDFSIVASTLPCTAAGVFTRSLFAGPSVVLCRDHLREGSPCAVATVSKNANVATGAQGDRDAHELAELVARGCRLPSGRRPGRLDRGHRPALPDGPHPRPPGPPGGQRPGRGGAADFASVARAIMTTDTVPKLASARAGQAVVTGIAKGSGMIQPDMATLLAYVFTDAAVAREELASAFRRVVDATFNSLSIDTDTSTSDTRAGPGQRGGRAGPRG